MFWHTLIVALVFFLTREHAAELAVQAAKSGINSAFVTVVIFLILFALLVLAFRTLLFLGEQVEKEMEKERSTKAHAHTLCDQALSNEISRISLEPSVKGDADRMATAHRTMRELVRATYQTFESAYGQVSKGQERNDFEVTYMTKSLRDNQLTVAAAANKDNRMPRSMVLREQQPDIYDQTVTADIYRASSPRIVIICDTSNEKYNELYPEQKRRIKSSIVFPVLTPDYKLLGALVVHCDKARFFSQEKEKYFSDLLEIFGKRIALEAVRIKRIVDASNAADAPF